MTASDILYSFPRKIDLGLTRVLAALDVLGRPQDHLPPIIHVAGTNGKGSTVAFMRAMVEGAGQLAHAYTSPHLVSIHERWRVAGKLMREAELYRLATQIKALSDTVPVTVFEAETLLAFLAFSQTPADFTLLEVGLGGRLDATNIVEKPAITVITPVDIDHADMLGSTLSLIATEKAGIVKTGVTCIVGRQHEEALASIEARAQEVGAPLVVFGRDWDCFVQRGRLVVQSHDRVMDLPMPSLKGAHQIENAGAAAMAMSMLGLDNDAIASGVQSAVWPARLQRLTVGPYADLANLYQGEVWLDGGHNPHGARAACAYIDALNKSVPRPFGLVTGLLARKDHGGFFAAFEAAKPFVVTVPITSSEASASADELAQKARMYGLQASVGLDPLQGLEAAFKHLGTGSRVLICGSLYLAGEVLSQSGMAQGGAGESTLAKGHR